LIPNFIDRVAQHILSCHAQDIPDLRGATVLLPNHHVAKSLVKALSAAADFPALLLPRMIVLKEWAQSVPIGEVQPDSQRLTSLYQALRDRRWFADADLWSLSRELLDLMDDLTRHHVALPPSEAEFLEQLTEAYQARSGLSMQFEARVVHELWYAMTASGELDSVRAYQHQLALLAEQVDTPLYVLLTSDMSSPEMNFLEVCRARVSVVVFDLREFVVEAPGCALLSRALHATDEGGDLRSDAAQLKNHPASNLATRLSLFGAHSLEQEARAAELQVRRWLLAGKQSIALIALDRVVARRVRALLERASILVQDETGWTMSTLAVSTVLMRWLDALQSDFYYQDLLDLLKSPYIFADQEAGERNQSVYQLEQLIRKHGVASHLDAFINLSRGEVAVQTTLVRLRQASEVFRRNSDTLSGWLHSLDESLSILGVLQGLATDEAGKKLLQVLQTWQQELATDNTHFSRSEWRRWLAQQLDETTFSDHSIESPVLLTSLASTRWRRFDAVVLLGSDASHLPGIKNGSVWFNDAVRNTLGLPTRKVHLVQQRDQLLGLLAMNDTVLATWQASKNGEQNLLSPYLEILRTLNSLAYCDDLAAAELGGLIENAQLRITNFPLPELATMPSPEATRNLIPQRISPSGYNSLMACPYQFYARYMLRLYEMDEVNEGVEKRDFGEWVHLILHRFHQQFPVLNKCSLDELKAALHRISDEVFAPAIEKDFLARAWHQLWQQAIVTYVEVQLKSEADGWRYQSGEVPFKMPVTDELILHGRMDRIDTSEDGSIKVLDYKMTAASLLRKKIKEPGEDVQLVSYAQVYEANEAAYLSIENNKVMAVEEQDVPALAQANIERLKEVFEQMREGAALPAHGAEGACTYCEMHGLCRKNEWSVS
jgi:ATP-dependent helicase/nuclease subunit B